MTRIWLWQDLVNEIGALWRAVKLLESQYGEHTPVVRRETPPPEEERVIDMIWIDSSGAAPWPMRLWDGSDWVDLS